MSHSPHILTQSIWGVFVMPDRESCRQRAVSEEYKDYIVGRVGTFWRDILAQDICHFPLAHSFQIVYANAAEVGNKELYEIPYYSIPKCFTLLDMAALQQAGIAQVQQIPGLELYGSNVMIGFIDTGILYENEIFRRLDGSTRILRIWDQTIQDGATPAGLWYGTEYTEAQINAALRSEHPREVVPSVDTNGHGTYVASIACGGASPEQGFLGAAPEADLVVVKLKEAKQYLRDFYFVKENAPCYQENDIMAGLYYLQQVARDEGKPLVVCMTLGTSMGGHSGAMPLSAYMEVMGNMPATGLAVGTGNEADKRHHYQGITQGETPYTVEINVGEQVEGFFAEIWTDIPNIYSVSIVSPSGESSFQIPIREESEMYEFLFEETRVYVQYRVLVESTNSEVIFLRFARPYTGIWKVNIFPIGEGNGQFHIWLPMEEFLTGEVFFLESSPECTILGPGNTQAAACAAYYNGADGSLAVSSGRGFTRTGLVKPDFAAPGVNVLGLNARGQFVERTGSSAAVALTAGAEALLLEWLSRSGKIPDSIQLKNLLILGAEKERGRIYPNREWGYGKLDVYETFLRVRNI